MLFRRDYLASRSLHFEVRFYRPSLFWAGDEATSNGGGLSQRIRQRFHDTAQAQAEAALLVLEEEGAALAERAQEASMTEADKDRERLKELNQQYHDAKGANTYGP